MKITFVSARFSTECFRLSNVIECSEGFLKTPYIGHMDIEQCIRLVERLRDSKALSQDAKVFTTHHAAMGNATHEELTAALAPYGIKPGFDGLSFEV
jgi:hypothetical protein